MSGYEYAYSVTPARPTGWGSVLAGFVTVVTVVAVSGISGAVVTLELIAPKTPHADTGPVVTARASETPDATEHTASIVAPRAPASTAPLAPASAAPVAQDHKPDLRTTSPTVAATAPPQSQPTIPAAPQVKPPAADAKVAAPASKTARAVPDSELTFAKGYAQRRAAQEAVAAHSPDSKVAAVSQLGRAAAPRKPAYARSYVSPDGRRLAARGEATGYYDRPSPYDFRRHEALAYGEEQRPRRPEPRGVFGGFFGNNTF